MSLNVPDRISALIDKIEAGTQVTRGDLRRTVALQGLDLARLGQDFAREVIEMNEEGIKLIEALE